MDFTKTRNIIISIEQLRIIKELIDTKDITNYPSDIKEEIELLSEMIEYAINEDEDIIHGFCY